MPAAPCTSGSTMSAAVWRGALARWASSAAAQRAAHRGVRLAGAAAQSGAAPCAGAQQRRVRVVEQRDVGHRERAERLAVIAAREADELRLAGRPLLRQ